jgi:peptide deformylase
MVKTTNTSTKPIVRHPAAVLAQVAKPVAIDEITSPTIQAIIQEMSASLHASPDGIGIAAPQIGYSLRIFVASEEALRYDEVKDIPEEERDKMIWKHFVFINPEIKKTSKKKLSELEGCLSVPGKFGIVDRAEKVTVSAYDEHGKKFERGTSNLYARLMQHEIDHLNGNLFIEKVKEWVEVEKEKKK